MVWNCRSFWNEFNVFELPALRRVVLVVALLVVVTWCWDLAPRHGMGHRSLRICDVFSGIWGPATVWLSSVLKLKFRWVVNLLNLSLLLSGGCLFFVVYLPNFHHSILLSIVKVNDLLYEQLYRFKWVIITSVHFFIFIFLMYWIMQGPWLFQGSRPRAVKKLKKKNFYSNF